MRGASPKKPRRRRRSELRMGVPSISYETTKVQPRLSLSPVITFWKQHGSRLVSGLLLLLLGIGLYILFSSPTFFIYNADIRGNAERGGHSPVRRLTNRGIALVDVQKGGVWAYGKVGKAGHRG
ncbi:MAG: hypothetical protein AAF485_12945, partial [Chloroflexota bacterium]